MPAITLASGEVDETLRRQPTISPEEHQLSAGSTCLTRCLYNIPPGVITALLPGLGLLVTGLVILALTTTTDQSSDGLSQLGVVTVSVAGAWTALVIGFWVTTCGLRYKLGKMSSDRSRKKDSMGYGVQLVAVSWNLDTPHPYHF